MTAIMMTSACAARAVVTSPPPNTMWIRLLSRCTRNTSETCMTMKPENSTRPMKCIERAPWWPPIALTNRGNRDRIAGAIAIPVSIWNGARMKMTNV